MSTPVRLIETVTLLREQVAQWRQQGLSVGFVPTMGALHAGHMRLVETALSQCDRVIASVFVNPTQFAAHEDLDRYPRQLDADAALLSAHGCHGLFAPTAETMYPSGSVTRVLLDGGPQAGLETDHRPQFFGGVATVVTKLLLQVGADKAFFGEKDYQQLLVIRRMVQDLFIPTEIQGVPTARETDGLALSSRNVYLSPEERVIAGQMNVILRAALVAVKQGAPLSASEIEARKALLSVGFAHVDYVDIRNTETLERFSDEQPDGPMRILAAAWLGKTRLIDNLGL